MRIRSHSGRILIQCLRLNELAVETKKEIHVYWWWTGVERSTNCLYCKNETQFAIFVKLFIFYIQIEYC